MNRIPTGRAVLTDTELAVAVACVVFAAIVFVTRPGTMGGVDPGPWSLISGAAFLVMLGATAWMVRIARAR